MQVTGAERQAAARRRQRPCAVGESGIIWIQYYLANRESGIIWIQYYLATRNCIK
jgi:hypothetical protein